MYLRSCLAIHSRFSLLNSNEEVWFQWSAFERQKKKIEIYTMRTSPCLPFLQQVLVLLCVHQFPESFKCNLFLDLFLSCPLLVYVLTDWSCKLLWITPFVIINLFLKGVEHLRDCMKGWWAYRKSSLSSFSIFPGKSRWSRYDFLRRGAGGAAGSWSAGGSLTEEIINSSATKWWRHFFSRRLRSHSNDLHIGVQVVKAQSWAWALLTSTKRKKWFNN